MLSPLGRMMGGLPPACCFPVETAVAEVDDQVAGNHDHIQCIEENNIVRRVDQLVDDPTDISEDDNQQKDQAFPLGGAGHIRFVHRRRPGRTETQQHHQFEYLCLSHSSLLLPDALFIRCNRKIIAQPLGKSNRPPFQRSSERIIRSVMAE